MFKIQIIFLFIGIIFGFFMIVITMLGESSIQSFSKAKLFCLYKNHRSFAYVKHFKEQMTELILSALMCTYVFSCITTILFNILTIEYFHMSIAISNVILTSILMLLEMSMKKVGLSSPEKIVLFIGPIYKYIHMIFSMLSNLLNYIINLIMIHIFRYKKEDKSHENELLSIIEMQTEQDQIMGSLIKNIMTIKNIYVDDVMTPNNEIIRIHFNKEINIIKNEVFNLKNEDVKSYIPLWNNITKSYMGVINTKKLLFYSLKSLKPLTVSFFKKNILEDMFFVPSGTTIYNMLKMFSSSVKRFAFVVNEYGDVVGVIALKDILEEIVGTNIFEDNTMESQKRLEYNNKASVMILSGDFSVKDLQQYFPNNFLSDSTYSISDLIINDIERIPEEGEEFIYSNISFTVLDRQSNKIDTLLVKTTQ